MTASDIAPNVPRVLIVEDDADTLAMMRKLLDRVPVSNVSVGSCDEARCAARSEPFDVVITDLRMPNVDGMTVVRTLRTEQPDVEIIVLTAFGDVSTAVGATRASPK